ncbi:MAG: hypothetical protein ACOYM2_12125 [Rectinemataceae bacterium]
MRTTLTLEDDVSVLLAQRQEALKLSLKDAVNLALRRGLTEEAHESAGVPYCTPTVSLGKPLLTNLDKVAELLAVAEGEGFS